MCDILVVYKDFNLLAPMLKEFEVVFVFPCQPLQTFLVMLFDDALAQCTFSFIKNRAKVVIKHKM